MALYLSEADVQGLLTMPLALEAVEQSMRDRTLGRALDSPRSTVNTPASILRVLLASAPELGYAGSKTSYNLGDRRLSFVQLIDIRTGQVEAIIDSDWMGVMRTGAASGIASRHLASPGATVLGQLGAGRQGYGQVEAVCAALNIRKVQVYSPTASRREAFCAFLSRKLDIEVVPVTSGEAAVRGAQVINVITQSATPVLKGEWLSAGQHINAAGANTLDRRELDEEAVRRSDVIAVDARGNARDECGDLLHAVQKKRLDWNSLKEIGEIMCGKAEGRTAPQQISLYESHGLGIQDIYVAVKVLERARTRGMGTALPIKVLTDGERVTFT